MSQTQRPARRRRGAPTRRWSTTAMVIAALAVATVLKLAIDHLAVTTAVVGVASVAAAVLGGRRIRTRLRRRVAGAGRLFARDPYQLSPGEFEEYLAELCRRDGCRDVTVVGGAGDLAADVLYTDPHGRRGLIQAKRYKTGNTVGSEHVQRVNGTYRHAHGCQHAAIVTTSSYTRAAEEFAAKVGIPLLAADRLTAWARGDVRAAPWN